MRSKPANDFAIVVSAMGGKPKTTDLLLGLVEAASTRDDETVALNLNLIKEKVRQLRHLCVKGGNVCACVGRGRL